MTFQGTPICKNRKKKRYQELSASGRPSQSHTSPFICYSHSPPGPRPEAQRCAAKPAGATNGPALPKLPPLFACRLPAASDLGQGDVEERNIRGTAHRGMDLL